MQTFQPDVVVLNAGFAHVIGFGPIIMGAEDVLKTHFVLPEAQIVATHMEAINHCLLTRAALKEYAFDNQIAQFVNVPEDGETLTFNANRGIVCARLPSPLSPWKISARFIFRCRA